MKTIAVNLYEYDELGEKAQQRAREWYLGCGLDYDWWDSTLDDARAIGLDIAAFDLDHRRLDGTFTETAQEVAQRILREHGSDCDTFKTARSYLHDVATLEGRDTELDEETLTAGLLDLDAGFQRELLEDYRRMLQAESDYLQSDESVAENIRINEYTFTVEGKRMDG